MVKRCPECHQVIRTVRSTDISNRFNGHCTFMTRRLNGQFTRDEVKQWCLIQAVEMDTIQGADPYPYVIIKDTLYPLSTSGRTNKEMMQACEGCQAMAVEWEIGPLPENYDRFGVPFEGKGSVVL